MLALDCLPWPWGEEILAGLFVAKALVQTSRMRQALRWAAARTGGGRCAWRLALASCAHHGRVVARTGLLGLSGPDQLRPHLLIRGQHHLESAPGAAILLGWHLGMPNSDVAFRMAGRAVAWIGGWRASRAWARPSWQPVNDVAGSRLASERKMVWAVLLLRAQRILLDGGTIYMTADGGGREAFRLPLAGGPMIVRSGWLALRERTRARVLPVLSHLEGRLQVITIHPPLPDDPAACEMVLGGLIEDYARRVPEQCYGLVFRRANEAALYSG
jgi:hypothetical protein